MPAGFFICYKSKIIVDKCLALLYIVYIGENKMKHSTDYKQTVKLSNLKGLSYMIAQKELEVNGAYFCLLDGVKTKVIK